MTEGVKDLKSRFEQLQTAPKTAPKPLIKPKPQLKTKPDLPPTPVRQDTDDSISDPFGSPTSPVEELQPFRKPPPPSPRYKSPKPQRAIEHNIFEDVPKLPERPGLGSRQSSAERPVTPVSRPVSRNGSHVKERPAVSPRRPPSPAKAPLLPIRPVSTHAFLPIVEVTSPTEEAPQLPRRIDQLPLRVETPRLPSRTSTDSKRLQIDKRSIEIPRSSTEGRSIDSDEEEPARSSDQPDTSTANRKPPRFKGTHWDINTGREVRKTAISGDHLMVAHPDKMRLHSIATGETLWQMPVVDTRVTAMDFRTVAVSDVADHGRFLWIGYKDGSLHEIDVRNRSIVERYYHAHSSAVVAILRCGRCMWTLDEGGNLYIWPDATSLKNRPMYKSVRTVIGVTTALVVGTQLWIGSGRSVHVFESGKQLTHDRGIEPTRVTGLITCAVHIPHTQLVYFGHDDGKISIYKDYQCIEVISISHYNLSGLLSVGDYLWASFKTGKVFVYDVHTKPWSVMKEWTAHKSPILELAADRSGLWKEKRLQVTSMAADGAIKIWDGLLMSDWLDAQMQRRITEFSSFENIRALICTWNAGASVPSKLSRDYEDAQFLENMIREADSPDIISFGFQELVDLDDKGKASRSVAKGFFGKKKEKEPDEKALAFAYQQWQNHLEKQVSIASSGGYHLLQVRSLVGLFTCLFVKSTLRGRISNVDASCVKTGLKGRYGNKGGIVIRMTLDDTSLCFVNCHLAAGQKHVVGRNNDIFSILEQANLPVQAAKNNVFVSGGDGSMVLDHEICILNGDLNYRINGQRSTVIQQIKEGKLSKLLENDQLLIELKRNATHRLRSFNECTIKFPPTYKYDPGTDNYDSSEKMRVPAWCDRIYYRGAGSVQCHSYKAHTCRVSDHRPVSAVLDMRVKTIDQSLRQQVYEEVADQWVELANKTIIARKLSVLRELTGKCEKSCKEALKAAPGQNVAEAAKLIV